LAGRWGIGSTTDAQRTEDAVIFFCRLYNRPPHCRQTQCKAQGGHKKKRMENFVTSVVKYVKGYCVASKKEDNIYCFLFLLCNNNLVQVSINGWLIPDEDFVYNSQRNIVSIKTENPGCWVYLKKKWWQFWKPKALHKLEIEMILNE
jgi:hypothetical protein